MLSYLPCLLTSSVIRLQPRFHTHHSAQAICIKVTKDLHTAKVNVNIQSSCRVYERVFHFLLLETLSLFAFGDTPHEFPQRPFLLFLLCCIIFLFQTFKFGEPRTQCSDLFFLYLYSYSGWSHLKTLIAFTCWLYSNCVSDPEFALNYRLLLMSDRMSDRHLKFEVSKNWIYDLLPSFSPTPFIVFFFISSGTSSTELLKNLEIISHFFLFLML